MGMELFGAKPERTIVIENAPLGVQSGHSAGAYVIAVTTGPIKEYVMREQGADHGLSGYESVADMVLQNL